MFSSHTFLWPKEDGRFWDSVRLTEPFDPERTLFVDDSPAVLAAARAAGIRWVIGLRHPDSQGTVRDHGRWPAVDRITDLAAPGSGLI
jgi:putative hydrolase of the HAD superfamily